jgi:hypothetical protein
VAVETAKLIGLVILDTLPLLLVLQIQEVVEAVLEAYMVSAVVFTEQADPALLSFGIRFDCGVG